MGSRFSPKEDARRHKTLKTQYNTNVHSFQNYTLTQKQQWVCNAGKNVTWSGVLDKPAGNTWWIGDSKSGYCTNNVVTILTQGVCPSWHDEIDVITNKNAYFCRNRDSKKSANTLGKYTRYHLEPGSEDYHGAQVLNNLGLSQNVVGKTKTSMIGEQS